MTKKNMLFALVMGLLTSSTYAGNLKDCWEDLQSLKTKANAANVADADFMTDFNTFCSKNADRRTSAGQNFFNKNESYVNFVLNYGPRIRDVQNGGVLDDNSKTALFSTQTFLDNKQNESQKKLKLFQDINQATANPPTDKADAVSLLTTLDSLVEASVFTPPPSGRYTYDPVAGTATHLITYAQQNYTGYSVAYRVLPEQNQLAVLTPQQLFAIMMVGADLAPVVSQLQQTNASIKTFVKTRRIKWLERAEQGTNPIAPVLPYAPFTPLPQPDPDAGQDAVSNVSGNTAIENPPAGAVTGGGDNTLPPTSASPTPPTTTVDPAAGAAPATILPPATSTIPTQTPGQPQ